VALAEFKGRIEHMVSAMRFFSIPPDYDCPFCKVAGGQGDFITLPSDIVYQDQQTTAFISPRWWPNNPGHVMIIPNRHYQDIFDLPPTAAAHIHSAAQKIAQAFMEVYGCDGISTRQHNGIYPMQEVFHYHFHLFPRYKADQLYTLDEQRYATSVEQRQPYAEKLRAFLGATGTQQ
jgi:histidine triad (HIT) family protein